MAPIAAGRVDDVEVAIGIGNSSDEVSKGVTRYLYLETFLKSQPVCIIYKLKKLIKEFCMQTKFL